MIGSRARDPLLITGSVPVGRVAETSLEDRTVRMPDGHHKRVAVVHRPRAVGVLPTRHEHGVVEVLLTSQPRPAVDGDVIEIVAGKMDPGDGGDPYVTGVRELAEEAGLVAEHWELLLDGLLPSPGYSDERVTLLVAEGLSTVASRPEDAHIRSRWYPLKTATGLIGQTILDAKTAVALLLLAGRSS